MSKSNATELDVLAFILQGVSPPWAAAANLYLALHTDDPTDAGDQTANEVAYGAYARVAVPRSALGWTVGAGGALNAALAMFPRCASGSATATHWSVGTASSGAGQILYSGALTAPLAISLALRPQIPAAGLQITED